MIKVSVFSLGCKVNQYEGGALIAALEARGYSVTENLLPADIYVLNTCAVTNEAERKSRQAISRIRRLNPDAVIIVCGCASESNSLQFEDDCVVYIGGVAEKSRIIEVIDNLAAALEIKTDSCDKINSNISIIPYNFIALDLSANIKTKHNALRIKPNLSPLPTVYEETGFSMRQKTRAFVKICDGCDNFCSYCIIPHLRGRMRSRSVQSVLDEVRAAAKYHKEVVLIGIDLSSYGKDIGFSLAQLVGEISGIRLRLGSLEVGAVNEELLCALKANEGFCPHFHLSLQSGSDEVLAKMNRKYSTVEYLRALSLIKEFFPDCAIATDIITGFPTESEENHKETLAFAARAGFSDIHVFPYSAKKGTPAAKMKQVDSAVKNRRASELNELKNRLRAERNASRQGKYGNVLIEGHDGSFASGYEKSFTKVYISNSAAAVDGIADVIMGKTFRDGVLGIIVHKD